MSLNDAGTAPAGPLHWFWMMPWMISAVPSVAMNAFTRSFVMIRPFTRPMPRPIATTSTTAWVTLPSWPSIVVARISDESEITHATDRSSEPSRITTVWPADTMPSATDRCRMFTMFAVVKYVPPSIVTTIQEMITMPSSAP